MLQSTLKCSRWDDRFTACWEGNTAVTEQACTVPYGEDAQGAGCCVTTFGELNLELKRGRPSHHRAREQPSGKRPLLLVCTQVPRHSLSDREPPRLNPVSTPRWGLPPASACRLHSAFSGSATGHLLPCPRCARNSVVLEGWRLPTLQFHVHGEQN